MFYDPKEDTSAADGVIHYSTIGDDAVAVPTHFFKICVWAQSPTNVRAITFVMENRGYPKPWNFRSFVKPVRWVEERTGLNFMPKLPAPAADAAETKVTDPNSFANN
jgi:DNA/RNA endonuclease G (NUC1)